MTPKKDIFDLENIKDIPSSTKADLQFKKKCGIIGSVNQEVLDLFYIKPCLSINEVIIGFYRKYKKETVKTTLVSRLGTLKKLGYLTVDIVNNERKYFLNKDKETK